jgi:hypothetical protein
MNTLATAVASTSGTSIDFTSIPSWVKRITVMFSGVSTNGTSNILIQLGSGSVTSSGYTSNGGRIIGATPTTLGNTTAGFIICNVQAATDTLIGNILITNISSNTWVASGSLIMTNATPAAYYVAGNLSLSGTLDRVRLTMANGTDTFDAGTVNILYEG